MMRTGDLENMHMRERRIVEFDPHYSKLLPEPSEQQIREAMMKSTNFSKVFLKTDEEMQNRLFEIASDSGMLRGLQVFHHHLNEIYLFMNSTRMPIKWKR